MTKKVIDVTDATFQQDVLKQSYNVPVVVDFWAPWCGPCRMLGPILERLAQEPDSQFILAKVNVDNNQYYSQQYGVQGIPAVKAFRDGQIVDQFVGAQPEHIVRQFVRKLAPTPSDDFVSQGNKFFNEGKWSKAASVFQQAVQQGGVEPVIRLKLAQALLRQGKGCDAQTQLQNFPASPHYNEAKQLLPLASYLCELSRMHVNGSELGNLYIEAGRQIGRGDYSAGMYNLLSIIRQDKTFRSGEPKDVMLGLFALLGENDEMTVAYRQQLASALW